MIRAKVSPSSSSPAVASAAASRGVRASRRGGFAATTAGRARDGEDRRRCCSVAVSAGAGRLGRDGGDRRRASSVISVGTSATRLNAVADKPSVEMIKGLTKPKDDTEYSAPPSVSDVLHDQTYAIVEVGGTQLIVQEGRQYVVNHLNVPPGTKIELNRVYAVKDGKSGAFKIGKPLAEKASVEALVLQTVRAPKVTVFKFKRKKHYKRTQGHRQLMSRFVVTKLDVALDGEDIAAASAAQSAPAPADE